jgi:hypothetical protein
MLRIRIRSVYPTSPISEVSVERPVAGISRTKSARLGIV